MVSFIILAAALAEMQCGGKEREKMLEMGMTPIGRLSNKVCSFLMASTLSQLL